MTTQVAPTSGLSATEVAERIAAGQVNILPPRSGRTTWDIIKANVFTRINFLLMVLFVIVLSTGSLGNALFGFLIIINSGIGAFQELRAKRTLDNLAVVGEGKPLVRRDGVASEIAREDVVLDDINVSFPHDLLQCNLMQLRKANRMRLLANADAVAHAQIENSVVGENVTIENSIAIRNTLVFDDTHISSTGDLDYAILTPENTIDCRNHFNVSVMRATA